MLFCMSVCVCQSVFTALVSISPVEVLNFYFICLFLLRFFSSRKYFKRIFDFFSCLVMSAGGGGAGGVIVKCLIFTTQACQPLCNALTTDQYKILKQRR